MANYKKITDVEVMEEVSENSMALVNENGVLKQVPCAGFGGGMEGVLIFSDIDGTITANMTFEEFMSLCSSQTLNMVVTRWVDTDRERMGFYSCREIIKETDYMFFAMYGAYGNCGGVQWYFNGSLDWQDPAE